MSEQKNKKAIISFSLFSITVIITALISLFLKDILVSLTTGIFLMLIVIGHSLIIFSIIFSILALKSIKETKEKGKILALIVIIGGISIEVLLIIVRPLLGIFLAILTAVILTNTLSWHKATKTKNPNDKALAKIISGTTIALPLLLILIGFFYVFLQPSPTVQEYCISREGIYCNECKVDITNKEISISFTNNIEEEIIIQPINITTNEGIVVAECKEYQIKDKNSGGINTQTTLIQPGNTFMFNNCTLTPKNTSLALRQPGDKIKLYFTFQYKSTEPNDSYHNTSGSLITTLR